MEVYGSDNVVEAALKRIEWLYEEFPVVGVASSGGKDSDVVLNLTLMVAEKLGKLPVPVIFLDQEAEWQATIDHMRVVMDDPRVKPIWLQIPFKLFNATSVKEPWLTCWEEGRKWMREKEPNAVVKNIYGTDRFKDIMPHVLFHEGNREKCCLLTGIRVEESPKRRAGCTQYPTYKWATWGKKYNQRIFTMNPIYDWSYKDVWKFIHEYDVPYNNLYNLMYAHGVPVRNQRVSNMHHETALYHLMLTHEFEVDTWNKLQERLKGVNSTSHLSQAAMTAPKKLPDAFTSWEEYRDYLLNNLVQDEEYRYQFANKFVQMEETYGAMTRNKQEMYRAQIKSLILNDYELETTRIWECQPETFMWLRYHRTGEIPKRPNKYI